MAKLPKPLSPAELAQLEHAFATDPGSQAYRPLTEAYLAAGRFMEAMVVCKKGVKAHPDDPAPRVLLARVYAEQGKDRKALEELQALLQVHPRDADANRLAGVLHLKLGDKAAGGEALRRAAESAPADPETQALLAQHGLSGLAPRASAPASDGPPVAPRVAAPGQPARAAGSGPAAHAPAAPVAPRVQPGRAPAPAPRAGGRRPAEEGADFRIDEATPLPQPAPARSRGAAYARELAEKYATQEFALGKTGEWQKSHRRGKGTLVTTVALFAVLGVALGGWVVLNKTRRARIERIDRLLKETVQLVEKDQFAAYQQAAGKAREILDADGQSIAGHAYLGYVGAVLWSEHGEPDALRDEATAHVQEGRALGNHSHLVAAEALLRFQGGDAKQAVDDLAAFVRGEGGRSALLESTLGILLMRAGDLDASRETLSRAQKANPGDVRTAAMLAEQYRRRGGGYELQASGFYDYALRIDKDHVGSLLGKAFLLVDRGQLDEAWKALEIVLAPQGGASKRQQAIARVLRGSVLYAQGRAAGGKGEEESAAKLDAANAEIPYLVGRRKLRDGDAVGASESIQRALALDGRRLDFHVDLTEALLAKPGGAKEAVDLLKRAVTRLGENPRLSLLLGDAYLAAGDADVAKGYYEKAIALGKPFPDARVALARMYRGQGNVPRALVELNQAIDEYGAGGTGGAAVAYVEMAETERARGARAALLADLYGRALERDPASCAALWGAVRTSREIGAFGDEARQRAQAYARICPRAPHADEARRLGGER
jgi:tetratricopeptide (TPR) repeat protein